MKRGKKTKYGYIHNDEYHTNRTSTKHTFWKYNGYGFGLNEYTASMEVNYIFIHENDTGITYGISKDEFSREAIRVEKPYIQYVIEKDKLNRYDEKK